MKLALKVDVDTYRGTRIGVPRLAELFKRHDAGATFLFSLGPDHTGRAIRRALRPGFLTKVSRTSVVSHYGFPTLLYGTLLPGPDIGKRCKEILRKVRDDGFEVGIHTWDHVEWQDRVATAAPEWTERQMQLAVDRFQEVFGEKPSVHGAAGWQMSRHALRLTQRLGFSYCADGRGTHPFIPVACAEIVACPQLPTTLPTLDEMIGLDAVTASNVAERLLALTAEPRDHIFTLHAELEGMKLLPVMEQLVEGWKAQGYQLGAVRDQFEELESLATLPLHTVVDASVAGRSGTLSTQGPAFLGTETKP
jgi:peptidoglycan/xylan/chitin deacetylase (PgdA/CDA1 family)